MYINGYFKNSNENIHSLRLTEILGIGIYTDDEISTLFNSLHSHQFITQSLNQLTQHEKLYLWMNKYNTKIRVDCIRICTQLNLK